MQLSDREHPLQAFQDHLTLQETQSELSAIISTMAIRRKATTTLQRAAHALVRSWARDLICRKTLRAMNRAKITSCLARSLR
jgi:hypothetical protein